MMGMTEDERREWQKAHPEEARILAKIARKELTAMKRGEWDGIIEKTARLATALQSLTKGGNG
jgi:hypothetical protein